MNGISNTYTFFCYPISVNEWNQITDALQIVGDRLKHARDGLRPGLNYI